MRDPEKMYSLYRASMVSRRPALLHRDPAAERTSLFQHQIRLPLRLESPPLEPVALRVEEGLELESPWDGPISLDFLPCEAWAAREQADLDCARSGHLETYVHADRVGPMHARLLCALRCP